MATKDTTNAWRTQKRMAEEMNVTIQAVNNWIKRKDKRIKAKTDTVTGKVLVKLV